ncbi:MAG TPA: hypothetical protein VHK01_00095 [Lacipirellulaceae bacterium]|nr:hypothetical protein [Lacipirellulaceae bacterium]
MEYTKQTIELLKWSIENSNSLWTYLHLAVIATVAAAWAIRGNVKTYWPSLGIAAAYLVFALGNLWVLARNQDAASAALAALLHSLRTSAPDSPLTAAAAAINVVPAPHVIAYHLFIDVAVVAAILLIGRVRGK